MNNLKLQTMKVSIQLRKFGKKGAQARLYFRVRDNEKDMKASSSLAILPEFWDSETTRYKVTTPTDIVSAEVQKEFNDKVTYLVGRLYASYYVEADILWLTTILSEVESQKEETAKIVRRPNVKKKTQGNTDKTMLEYFQIYLDTSNFNAWHRQAQTAVMKKVERFEGWLQFKKHDKAFRLNLPFFDKEGTEEYLDYIENEWQLREQYPKYFSTLTLYADYNIRPMSKNTVNCSAKRLFMFLNWCVKNGFLGSQSYNNVTIDQQVYGTPYYLTIEERDKVFYTDFSFDARLEYHRDKFIFQCLVGCRHNDLAALTWNHIIDGNFIEYIPHKNLLHGKMDTVRCPLCDKAKEILERLDPTMPYLFVGYCEENYRRDIKRILEIAGIDRRVTVLDPQTRRPVQKPIYEVAASHLARRTFIGNIYKQVHDPALISSLTGHAEHSKAFERYRDIDDDIKRDILKLIK